MIRPAVVEVFDITRSRIGPAVAVWKVGFDVQDRGAVQQVTVGDLQDPFVDTREANGRKTDRVRALRRPRREHAALALVARRLHLRRSAASVMAPEQQPDVAEPAEILETVLHTLADLDLRRRTSSQPALPRRFVVHLQRAPHEPDGVQARRRERPRSEIAHFSSLRLSFSSWPTRNLFACSSSMSFQRWISR